MNKLIKAITKEQGGVTAYERKKTVRSQTFTTTENGALTPVTSNSDVLDLFSQGGALRQNSEEVIVDLVSNAAKENLELAFKCLFYLRDIRGGQGERRTFRVGLNALAKNYPDLVIRNLKNVPFYGRWDDLFALKGNLIVWPHVVHLLKKQLIKDWNIAVENNKKSSVSLLAKWMPSINTSSKETVKLAKMLAKDLGFSEKKYRHTLSYLRSYLNVVEQKMCGGNWNVINYEQVPSRASMIYCKAFARHDADGYQTWQSAVEKGEAKVNAGALYPYDVVAKLRKGDDSKTLELLWNNLPDFLAENPHNGLVVADVSGSMTSTKGSVAPIDVSVSLALYFAEKNVGAFNGYFMTFSAESELVKVEGSTIKEKINNINDADWGMNTNLQSVFNRILNTAKANKVPAKEMPSVIYIVSDMQFDAATSNNDATNFKEIARQYKNFGYSMPKLVFWNVNATVGQSPAKTNDVGVVLLSGCSPSVFQYVMNGTTPYQFMLKVLNSERYKALGV
jgi:hypothetical protein